MVWECYKKIDIPIIGMGGIVTGEDAVEFMLAGASAVAVGTGNFINPFATVNVISGIKQYMKKNNMRSSKELTGGLIC